ncbi:hypothetical protein FZ983_27130 [Azospirillum sp. B21]|uniref:hypothetical protein n=1 Tax=Azospirillum sp. B21 TaxID=2607496 RepID=UPI0011EE1F96|nr:hypothetical protein [Azospirillum sp. B21]KAA0574578.1 hypothetical protein FZ983_27130 [Azospirillum sp. B21]
MTRLTVVQAKLYRALLARRFGNMTILPGPEAQASGQETLHDGTNLSWSIILDRTSGSWVLKCFVNGLETITKKDCYLGYIDYEISDFIEGEFHKLQCREDAEAAAAAKEEKRIRKEAFLKELSIASDEVVLRHYLKAIRATRRADERESEWDWHPAYTGPDDPGREYYENAARAARRREETFESELRRRGVLPSLETINGLLRFFDEHAPEGPCRSEGILDDDLIPY